MILDGLTLKINQSFVDSIQVMYFISKTGSGNKQTQIQHKTLIYFKFHSGQELVRICAD